MILEGFLQSGKDGPLLIVGDHSGRYGRSIFREFGKNRKIRFLGGLFDQDLLDHLRHYSKAAFHGHSAGGTNPSLLEAMAAGALIITHDNVYNRWVLGENAVYFKSAVELAGKLTKLDTTVESAGMMVQNNIHRIHSDFRWDLVVRQYEELFFRLIQAGT
jgi:glycosyltransferase involved in cell wall biosynthesis